MTAVVFDIGNVLIKWDPVLAWLDDLGSREAVETFLDRVDFYARNLRGDKGETFVDLAAEVDDAADSALLADYVARFHLTVPEKITGTWDILFSLKEKGVATHAITNWSAETWPQGLQVHPELGEVFAATIVSGEEKLLKPEAAIFSKLCTSTGLAPEDCIFIDDSPKNVAGAEAFGMAAIHFTTPEALHIELSQRGLL